MTQATNTILGEIKLTGDLAGDGGPQVGTNPQLTKMPGVVPGTYSSPEITVDSKGRITNVTGGTGPIVIKSIPGASKSRKGIVSIGDNLYIDEHDVAGTWTVNFGKALTEEASTGLCDNSFGQYSFSVTFETTTFVIDFTGAEVQTYGQFVTLINSKISSKGMVQIDDGDLKFTSNLADRTSSVSIGTGALESMQFFLSVGTGQDGQDNCSLYAKRATAEDFGVIRAGEGLEVVDGSLNVDIAAVVADIPDATPTEKGIVKVGAGLDVTSGVISVPTATTTKKGIVQVGSGLNIDAGGIVAVDIPAIVANISIATDSAPGIVQIGAGLSVDSGGIVAVDVPAVVADIPTATTTKKGIIQIGSGVNVNDGVISVPAATTTKKGIVQIGAGLDIDTGGNLRVKPATTSTPGIVQIGSGLSVNAAGELTVSPIPPATTSTPGIVQIGSGVNVTDGIISIPPATTSTPGIVQIGSGLSVDADGIVAIDRYNLPIATSTEKGVARFLDKAFEVDPYGAVSIRRVVPADEYAGGPDIAGIASYNSGQFDISTNGEVSIKRDILDSIARVDAPNRFTNALSYTAVKFNKDPFNWYLNEMDQHNGGWYGTIGAYITGEANQLTTNVMLIYTPNHFSQFVRSASLEQRIRFKTKTRSVTMTLSKRAIASDASSILKPNIVIATIPPNSFGFITLEYFNPNWEQSNPGTGFDVYVKNVSIYPV